MNRSEARKQFWDSLPSDKRAAICRKMSDSAKRKHSRMSSAERDRINRKRSKSLKAYWSALSEAAREERIEPIRAALQDYIDQLSPRERRKHYEEHARRKKEWWSNPANDIVRTSKHMTPSGIKINVHSRWEAHTADILDSLNVPFKRGPVVHHASGIWRPDFIVNGNLILEVKGYFLARKRFELVHLPHLEIGAFEIRQTTRNNLNTAIAVLNHDPKEQKKRYLYLDHLLDDLAWVHIPHCLLIYRLYSRRRYQRENECDAI